MDRRRFLGASAAALGPAVMAARAADGAKPPLRLGMAGLAHGHASGFFQLYRKSPIATLVGVSEGDRAVAGRYGKAFGLDPATIFPDIEAMLDRARPEAVVGFTATADHLAVIAACARRKIPVMVEKPLATTVEQARAIEKLAGEAGIPVLVNYETTWTPSHIDIGTLARDGAFGPIRKVVVHDGHKGPKEIGVQPEFLDWLADPVRNGAGALFDFGCYGANLMTWMMDGARPRSVTATARTFKPDVYPRVDDDATILLDYPDAQATLMASWNWPISRKDMEVYGRTGQAETLGRDALRVHLDGQAEALRPSPPLPPPRDDFLRYFAAVVRGEIKPDGLSALPNNLIVVEILDAARRSIAEGRTIRLG